MLGKLEQLDPEKRKEVFQDLVDWLRGHSELRVIVPTQLHAILAGNKARNSDPRFIERQVLFGELITTAEKLIGKPSGFDPSPSTITRYIQGNAGNSDSSHGPKISVLFVLWLDSELSGAKADGLAKNKGLMDRLDLFNSRGWMQMKLADLLESKNAVDRKTVGQAELQLAQSLGKLLKITPTLESDFVTDFLSPDEKRQNRHFIVYRRSEQRGMIVKGFLIVEAPLGDNSERLATFSHFQKSGDTREVRGIAITMRSSLYYLIGASGLQRANERPELREGVKCIVLDQSFSTRNRTVWSGMFLSLGSGSKPIAGRCVVLPCKAGITRHQKAKIEEIPDSKLEADLLAFIDPKALGVQESDGADPQPSDFDKDSEFVRQVKAIRRAIDNSEDEDLAGPLLMSKI